MAAREKAPRGRKIPLVEGGHALVDEASFNLVSAHRWHKCGFCNHVFRTVKVRPGEWSIVYLACEVSGSPHMWIRGSCAPCPALPD